ncbi:MAG: hypothetical protein V7K62_11975 [Nostoc sp.]
MPTASYAYAAILKSCVPIWIELMRKQGQQETFKPVCFLLPGRV